MKAIKSFFANMLTDHDILSRPPVDASSLMYSYITFTNTCAAPKKTPAGKGGRLISFTDYKLRRA